MRLPGAQFMRDGVHQMGFAQTDTAIQEQRVECDRPAFGDAAGGGMGQFVWFAHHKAVKGKAGVKGRHFFVRLGRGGGFSRIDNFQCRAAGVGGNRK